MLNVWNSLGYLPAYCVQDGPAELLPYFRGFRAPEARTPPTSLLKDYASDGVICGVLRGWLRLQRLLGDAVEDAHAVIFPRRFPLLDPGLVGFLEQPQREGGFAGGFPERNNPGAPRINIDRNDCPNEY